MQDYDKIWTGYIFESKPTVNDYQLLFERLLEYIKNDKQIKISIDQTKADSAEAAEFIHKDNSGNIRPPVELDISIASSKEGRGLLLDPWVPHLRSLTWIYRLKRADDGEGSAEIERLRREFIDIHALAAEVLEPRWAFGRRGGLAIGEDESIEELTEMTTPPLYEYNYFRPETVDALGWDRVLTAPAWYVNKLDSGGVFLAVREPPKQCSPGVDACVEVADHLGIPLATPERYH